MLPARRNLPSLTALTALEALDRLGSGAAAAEDMSLSQSAISRQLQGLEAQLGVSLIERAGRGLRLTEAGRAYAQSIRGALQTIADAGLALQLPQLGGTINLAILPSFGMRWLVPRLPDFARRHPDITLNLSTRLRPFDFSTELFDAALHFGAPDWPGTDHMELMVEDVTPVCAPSLAPEGPVALSELARLPLLHIQTRPGAWQAWFKAQSHDVGPLPGPSFDQFTTIIQAAKHGLGVALLPTYLAQDDLAARKLVHAVTARPVSLGAYHLVWPREAANRAPLVALRDWLGDQAGLEDLLPR